MIATNHKYVMYSGIRGLICVTLALLLTLGGASALASDAETSASATSGRGTSGTAAATAHYEGDVGFTRTDTRTGAVNAARAVAVGVDEKGVSLSVSTAVAPRSGPAIGVNFNMTIGTNGSVASSVGNTVATGGSGPRSVAVSGATDMYRGRPTSSTLVSGHTTGGGHVRAHTESYSRPAPRVVVRHIVRMP